MLVCENGLIKKTQLKLTDVLIVKGKPIGLNLKAELPLRDVSPRSLIKI